MKIRTAAFFTCLFLLTAFAASQENPDFTIKKIGDGVYAAIGSDSGKAGSNAGFIIGENAVLVVRRRILRTLVDRGRVADPGWIVQPTAPAPPPPLAPGMLAALADGRLELHGSAGPLPVAAPFEAGAADPLHRYAFHELGWLYAAQLAAPAPFAARLRRWLTHYLAAPPSKASVYWDPYPLGGRILFCRAMIDAGLVEAAPSSARSAAGRRSSSP